MVFASTLAKFEATEKHRTRNGKFAPTVINTSVYSFRNRNEKQFHFSLSRYKLKFSPDKVDTMIVQAVNLLDELDAELNNYIMRCREWYSWHFPELGTILTDNMQFIKAVKIIGWFLVAILFDRRCIISMIFYYILSGTRDNVKTCDLSDILTEDVEERIKTVAEMSMGTEITEQDITNIWYLCDQVRTCEIFVLVSCTSY